MMPSRSLGLRGGLLDRQRMSEPGPGSISRLVLARLSHIPPDRLSCCITTKRAPAVPRNFMVFSAIILVHTRKNIKCTCT